MGPERHLLFISSEHRHYSTVLYKEVPRHHSRGERECYPQVQVGYNLKCTRFSSPFSTLGKGQHAKRSTYYRRKLLSIKSFTYNSLSGVRQHTKPTQTIKDEVTLSSFSLGLKSDPKKIHQTCSLQQHVPFRKFVA